MKKIILNFGIFLVLMFMKNLNAQNYFNLVVNNNTNCDVTVEVYGGSPSTLLATLSVPANTSDFINCNNDIPLSLRVYDGLNSTGCWYNVIVNQTTGYLCPNFQCNNNCCFLQNNVLVTSSLTGPVGPPPGSCGTLGFLYTQTVNFN